MRIITSLMLLLGTLFVFGTSSSLAAYNPLGAACDKANVSNSAACQDAASQSKSSDNPVIKSLAWVTKVISIVIGFLAIIMIVVSGLNLITSAGNAESVTGAKKRLTAAIIGLALASFAWVIASYVIDQIL